jgi:hypothetical protein
MPAAKNYRITVARSGAHRADGLFSSPASAPRLAGRSRTATRKIAGLASGCAKRAGSGTRCHATITSRNTSPPISTAEVCAAILRSRCSAPASSPARFAKQFSRRRSVEFCTKRPERGGVRSFAGARSRSAIFRRKAISIGALRRVQIRPNSDTQVSRLERLFMPPLPPLPMVDKPAQLVESRHSSSLSEIGLESHNACQ